jgi:hypothetical protein
VDDPILEALAMVLEPLPAEYRDTMLQLARREIDDSPLIGYCWDGVDEGEVSDTGEVLRPWAYEVAKPSPRFPSRTVFCMFHDEGARCVAAFTFEAVEVDGKQGVQFYRELVFEPKIVSGPLKPKALLNEFLLYLGRPEDDDPRAGTPAPARNGAARP